MAGNIGLGADLNLKPKIGLRGKFTLAIIPSILIIAAALTLLGSRYISDSFNREYEKSATLMKDLIDVELLHLGERADIGNENFVALLQEDISFIMERNPEVSKVSVYAPVDGAIKIIASSEAALIGQLADADDAEPMITNETVFVEEESEANTSGSGMDEGNEIEMLAPLNDAAGATVASLGIYMDTSERDSLIRSQQLQFILVTNLSLLGLLLLLFVFINRNLLLPLKGMVRAVKTVSDSRGITIPDIPGLSRDDEIGNLARTFEDMSQSLNERQEEIALLLDASMAVSSALHVDKIMQILCEKVSETKKVTYCRIALLDESRKVFTVRAAYPTRDISDWESGIGDDFDTARARLHAEVLKNQKPLVVRHEDGAGEEELEWVLTPDTQSALMLPLVSKNKPIGVVTLGEIRRWERTPFTQAKIEYYQALVNQAAVAIESAELYEQAEWHVQELSTMHTISQAFTATLDYQQVISVVAKKVGELFDAQFAAVMMPDEQDQYLNIVASFRLSAEYVWTINKKRRIPVGVGPIGLAFSTGEPTAVVDVSNDLDYELWRNIATVQNYSSLVALPLISKNRSIGVISIYFDKPRRFADDEMSLLRTIANEAAIAIENSRIYENLQDAFVGTIRSLAETIDAKDSYTRGHSERVSLYAEAIARGLSLNGDELQTIRYAGYLHDVGKIGIPDLILTKPGKLTAEEFGVIKKHPVLSERILRPVNFPFPVQSIVRHHHERFDGQGYPDGLAQEEIPLGARILFVADAYEAMTSDRPYRKALSNSMALEELVRNRGSQFDPRIVDAFARIVGSQEDSQEDLQMKAS